MAGSRALAIPHHIFGEFRHDIAQRRLKLAERRIARLWREWMGAISWASDILV